MRRSLSLVSRSNTRSHHRRRVAFVMAALASSPASSSAMRMSSSSPLLRTPPKLTTPTTVLWFRNNLRLDDNPTLVAACRDAAARGDALLPIVCLDAALDDDGPPAPASSSQGPHKRPASWPTLGAGAPPTAFGSPKIGAFRAQFLLEAVDDLQANWAKRYGASSSASSPSELVVLTGSAPEVIAALGPMVTTVHAPQEVNVEEVEVERQVQRIVKQRE